MKKKILIMVICSFCLFGLTACTDTNPGAINFSNRYVTLKVVETSHCGRVLVDESTGVLYLWYKDYDLHGQTLTPLYNADGSPKNISDYEK